MQHVEKRAGVAFKPCVRFAFDYLGIRRRHVSARATICVVSSLEPKQRADGAQLLEQLLFDNHRLSCFASACLVPGCCSVLEMWTTGGSTLLPEA